jgi:hypothetical protein
MDEKIGGKKSLGTVYLKKKWVRDHSIRDQRKGLW